MIERLNREIRRRTRVVGTFPDGNSALMLVCARLRHVAGTQWGSKKYMNMKHLEAVMDDASKNQFIRARVAGWEKDCIRRKADAAHMTESEFVRRAAMDREVTVIEGMDELLRELRYQGNNLNQLTVMARQGRITQVNYEPFTEVYRNAWQTLNSLLSHAV